MNHKRKRHKGARAGCLLCKPHKENGRSKTKLFLDNFKGGWRHRANEAIADNELRAS